MASAELQRIADDWATAWSCTDSGDPENVLALFTEECVFEDVTFGVVARGTEELRGFANRAFAAVPDFRYGLASSFVTFRGYQPPASAFRRCEARPSSNWSSARSAASLTTGMQPPS
jgi:hypothetical protein